MSVDQSFALAHYKSLYQYRPKIGDFIVWAGWFRTWYGVVSGIDGDVLIIVFEGLPSLLFNSLPHERQNSIKQIPTIKITSAKSGEFAVLQYDAKSSSNIWYI